jgi:hypothetical protein
MKYLVKDSQDNLVMIGATGFTPQGVIAPVPKELASEEASWLKVVEIEDEEMGTRTEVQVDEDLKAQILSERVQLEAEAKAQETAKMLAREERITRSKANPLRTIEDLRQAVQDILDHLGMK